MIGYYYGKKDSERNVVTEFIKAHQDLSGQAFSLDALHNSAACLAEIAIRKEGYISQVKANQKELLEDLELFYRHFVAQDQLQTFEKGHGRIETRKVFIYPLTQESLP